jgi:sec-independent protein translocase protein TatC
MAAPLAYSDDYFGPTRMPLGHHLEDLRLHLWRALAGFAAVVVLSFLLDLVGYLSGTSVGVGKPVMDWICLPVQRELESRYQRRLDELVRQLEAGPPRELTVEVELGAVARELAPLLGVNPPAGTERRFRPFAGRLPPATWRETLELAGRVLKPPRPVTLSATEAMTVYFKVTFVSGVVLASPWVFWQLWSFVAAGLYPHEKRYVHRFLPFSVGLFLGGVAVCQWVVMPAALEALLGFNEWLGLEPELRLSEWLSFTLLMPLVFGLSFQTPLVMLLLERLGVLGVDAYRGKRRAAWFLLAVFAAVVTPSVDFYSMMFLWVPLGLLYELGIVLCLLGRQAPGALPGPPGAVEV